MVSTKDTVSESSAPQPLSETEFRRHWRTVTVAGMLGMTYYTCIASAPRTKFLVQLHATAFDFGLIAGLSAVMLVFQLVSGVWTNRIRHRKRTWTTIYLVHRLLFLGVLLVLYIY